MKTGTKIWLAGAFCWLGAAGLESLHPLSMAVSGGSAGIAWGWWFAALIAVILVLKAPKDWRALPTAAMIVTSGYLLGRVGSLWLYSILRQTAFTFPDRLWMLVWGALLALASVFSLRSIVRTGLNSAPWTHRPTVIIIGTSVVLTSAWFEFGLGEWMVYRFRDGDTGASNYLFNRRPWADKYILRLLRDDSLDVQSRAVQRITLDRTPEMQTEAYRIASSKEFAMYVRQEAAEGFVWATPVLFDLVEKLFRSKDPKTRFIGAFAASMSPDYEKAPIKKILTEMKHDSDPEFRRMANLGEDSAKMTPQDPSSN